VIQFICDWCPDHETVATVEMHLRSLMTDQVQIIHLCSDCLLGLHQAAQQIRNLPQDSPFGLD